MRWIFFEILIYGIIIVLNLLLPAVKTTCLEQIFGMLYTLFNISSITLWSVSHLFNYPSGDHDRIENLAAYSTMVGKIGPVLNHSTLT